jgi:hypothetical protein
VGLGVVGDELGDTLGDLVGDPVGDPEGDLVGDLEGDLVGGLVGEPVGEPVGEGVGPTLGELVGTGVVGVEVGAAVGEAVGEELRLGEEVGDSLGDEEGLPELLGVELGFMDSGKLDWLSTKLFQKSIIALPSIKSLSSVVCFNRRSFFPVTRASFAVDFSSNPVNLTASACPAYTKKNSRKSGKIDLIVNSSDFEQSQ